MPAFKHMVALICAKTKVAPIKPLTIPRLELLGAVLLDTLIKWVTLNLKNNPSSFKTFCDSKVVQAWIRGPASKYEIFVRNCIDYITSIVPTDNWAYVKSADNPADLLTHGVTPVELAKSSLWLYNPTWLQNFSLQKEDIELLNNPSEQRRSQIPKVMLAISIASKELITKYLSYNKLVRITTFIKTFINRVCKTADCTIYQATEVIYRMSQSIWFTYKINELLSSLEPFLDENGILRCGGRLENANLPYNTKYPIILHCKSKLSKLLVKHAHKTYCHASCSFVLAYLQRKYYLVHEDMKFVRNTMKCCVYCTHVNAKTVKQIMGDLPSVCTQIARPFTNCGIDFAGPITIHCTNHRSSKHLKHYAAFFICLTTRAMHIESVANSSTEAFMSALRRFIARCGIPHSIWSDNATNFVGAKNLISKALATLNIEWRFIMPRTPHHGGVWEATVKAGKRHLLSVSDGSILTEDEFKTTLASVE